MPALLCLSVAANGRKHLSSTEAQTRALVPRFRYVTLLLASRCRDLLNKASEKAPVTIHVISIEQKAPGRGFLVELLSVYI